MNDIASKFKRKGLVVIGVTDEEYDLVDQYVAERGIEYRIARLTTAEFETAIDVGGFPSAAILDADGQIVWTGHPMEANNALEKALKGSKAAPFLPAKLAAAEALLDKPDYAAAYVELKRLGTAELEQAEAKHVARLVQYLEAQAERLWKQGQEALGAADYYAANRALARLAKGYAGIGAAAQAKAKVEEFAKDPAISKEIQAGTKLAEAAHFEAEYDFDAAYKLLKSVAAKYAGTSAAERAAARAGEIKEGGLLGLRRDCADCMSESKACPRHAQK